MRGMSKFAAAVILTLTGVASASSGQAMHPKTTTRPSAPGVASMAMLPRHRFAARAQAGRYDGAWSIIIQTVRGDCPAAIRAGVHILAGRLVADDQSYRLAGRVAASGVVRVSVSAAGQSAGGSGRLGRLVGHGRWRSSSDQCAGQWTAQRRG